MTDKTNWLEGRAISNTGNHTITLIHNEQKTVLAPGESATFFLNKWRKAVDVNGETLNQKEE